jgi:hypothetical protein
MTMSTFALPAKGKARYDHEAVRPFLSEFTTLREGMAARGEYPYNDAFRGLIPGIAGDDEDAAIYLLQGLYQIEEEHAEIEALVDEGYRQLEFLVSTTRFANVVAWQPDYYVGGTGRIDRFENARVVVDGGRITGILPKGRRTHGLALRESAKVYVR